MTQQFVHGPLIRSFQLQVTVLNIPNQQISPFQIPANTVTDRLYKLIQRFVYRRFDTVKYQGLMPNGIYAIKEQHMEMDIQIERTTKALDDGTIYRIIRVYVYVIYKLSIDLCPIAL
jgi:hypothetical protein